MSATLRHVNAISARLSLRKPQREALEILNRVCALAPPRKSTDAASALAAISGAYPSVRDFEREFASLCFALATGVGKTRLMGAFIAYLHLAHSINNFFVLAPNLTIYDKLIRDFQPNTAKYVFQGIGEFAQRQPELITGENYADKGQLLDQVLACKINIFNISKINSEVRGGKSPKFRSFKETLGESYFDYLAELPDLVMLMDESHRYRATAGVRAINELKPVLGLELTATPFVESNKGPVAFKNVVLDYPLARAMEDGFVKEPAVVTRKDFVAAGKSVEDIERIKLEDGLRLHETVKVDLETYARNEGVAVVKPFLLVIARDTTHARQLVERVSATNFFDGVYAGKVLQVDSSRSGAEEDEMIRQLLDVESRESPIEIVIHVNMLKEGWDVTNLYTIVPLRAANARTLIEQSIGRGLRLPYGKRTGVVAVDRLNIVAHDKFQEIVDEANRSDSIIRMQQVVLDDESDAPKPESVVARRKLDAVLGQGTANSGTPEAAPSVLVTAEDRRVAEITLSVIRRMETRPDFVPNTLYLQNETVQQAVVREVQAEYRPAQMALDGIGDVPDIAAIVKTTTTAVVQQTISIPRIITVPRDEVKSGFKPFTLDLSSLRLQAPSQELWVQHLRTREIETIQAGGGGIREERLENYVVRSLIDFDDIAYDSHAGLLFDLAAQAVEHFRSYLSEDDVWKLFEVDAKRIAAAVHAQMQDHYWEESAGFDTVVKRGFVELKQPAFTKLGDYLDFRQAPTDKSTMNRYIFTGFKKCLYVEQKFDSNTERMLAIILDRDSEKWFRPARGQFQISYRWRHNVSEYHPDFVAETAAAIYLIEPKMAREMDDGEVLAKAEAAKLWCDAASDHAASHGSKPWQYVRIPHDVIAENMSLKQLVHRYI